MKFAALIFLSLWSLSGTADDSATRPLQLDEEAGAVVQSGNASSETYNVKSDNMYTENGNVYRLTFDYLDTRTFADRALFWDTTARYERILFDRINAFADEKWESDARAGYTQRTSTDVGGKYYFVKSDENTLLGDLGYRYGDTLQDFAHTYANYARIYGEWTRNLEKIVSFKVWIEYLPNFSQPSAYLFNCEESLSFMLANLISFKVAYLTRYQAVVLPGLYNTDNTTTIALVAKF
jgi:putative salt-induced outer membrane protein YdiY